MAVGGEKAIYSLAVLFTESMKAGSRLAELLEGCSHTTAYSLTCAMLKVAGDSRVPLWPHITPKERLPQALQDEVIATVHELARGNHPYEEITSGARLALFETAINSPFASFFLNVLNVFCLGNEKGDLRIHSWLADLPRRFTSSTPHAVSSEIFPPLPIRHF